MKQELKYREQEKTLLPLKGIGGELVCLAVTDGILSSVKSVQAVYQKVTKKNKGF